jgi:hypothetical protein
MAALDVANVVLNGSNFAVQVSFDDVRTVFNGFGHHGALGAVAPHTRDETALLGHLA